MNLFNLLYTSILIFLTGSLIFCLFIYPNDFLYL